jgi:hypothetical protein
MKTADSNFNHPDISKTKNPFRVPDGYFDSVPERIMSRIDTLQVPETKRSSRSLVMWLSASAAAIVLVLVLTLFGENHSPSTELTAQSGLSEIFFDSDALTVDESELLNWVAADLAIEIKEVEPDYVNGLKPEEIETIILF